MALKQHLFLGSVSINMFPWQDKHSTLEILLEMVFSILSVQMGYKEDNRGNQVSSVWGAVKKRNS
jgi:hypothetical protein